MVRSYAYVALIAALIYPLMWPIFLPGAVEIIYGSLIFGVVATSGVAFGAVLGIILIRVLVLNAPKIFRGFLVRIIGAELAGIFAFSVLFLCMVWEAGTWPPFSAGFWFLMHAPAVCSAYVSYWIVSLLVKPIAHSL